MMVHWLNVEHGDIRAVLGHIADTDAGIVDVDLPDPYTPVYTLGVVYAQLGDETVKEIGAAEKEIGDVISHPWKSRRPTGPVQHR